MCICDNIVMIVCEPLCSPNSLPKENKDFFLQFLLLNREKKWNFVDVKICVINLIVIFLHEHGILDFRTKKNAEQK